jgi:hypothetical protein
MARKRRPTTAKPGELRIAWGCASRDHDPDICYLFGDGVPPCDARLLDNIFDSPRVLASGDYLPSLYDELKARGYDITTLKFSIQKIDQERVP